MKPKYFCPYHIERIHTCEQSALVSWNEMMRRGVQAYASCRADAARIYLDSAIDISLLRYRHKNLYFSELHIAKPLDFLVELFLANENFTDAFEVLAKISSVIDDEPQPSTKLRKTLEKHYRQIEVNEKRFFSKNTPPNRGLHLHPVATMH